MSCHSTACAPVAERGQIALVGNPNVGKSALFRRLTGRYVVVANYGGTTVELSRGQARFAPDTAVLDTPGVVAFPPRSDDERLVSRLLLREPVGALVQVADAKNVRRTLQLALQLAELELPFVLALNMADEAEAAGVRVDRERLAGELGVPVVATTATTGAGVDELVAAIAGARPSEARLEYPPAVEAVLGEIAALVGEAPVAPRGLALLWLAGDDAAVEWVEERLEPATLARLEERRDGLEQALGEPVRETLQRTRRDRADELFAAVATTREPRGRAVAALLGRLATHPLWGLPILAAVLYGVYWFVGVFGAGTLVGLLEETIFGAHLNPWLADAVERIAPVGLVADLLVGEFGLWTMGMTYALALILPIVTTFFLAFGILEDSGYLPRLAVVSNRLFTALGLNGKAALPMVLGLGCVTMATLTTRILESRRERLLATLLLAIGIPCSAQLGIVLGMLGAISPVATLIWLSVVAAVVVAVGALAARVVPGERAPLVLELPPLRVPRPANVAIKTAARLEWYLKEVVPLFLAGTLLLFVLDETGALPAVVDAARPLVSDWLGLPAAASAAFLVGFLRRDFGATGLFVLHAQGQLTAEQAVVAMITITLFIPCIASVLVIVRERGAAAAAAIVAFVFPLAFLVGGLIHRALLLSGWGT